MRSARILVLCVALLSTVMAAPAAADPLDRVWTEEVGASAMDVAVAPDGSVYVVGHIPAPDPALWKARLTKLTPAGEVIWSRTFTPAERVGTWGVAVDVAPDGRVAWVGSSQRFNCEGGGWWMEIRGPAGGLIDRTVSPEWRCVGAPKRASDVAIDDDRIVVSGFLYGCCGEENYVDGWVRSYSTSGAPRWHLNLEPPAPTPTNWYDEATSVALGQNRIFIGGWAATTAPSIDAFPEGTMLLAALTPNGRIDWLKRVAGVSGGGIVTSFDGYLLVTASDDGRGVFWRYGGRGSNGWLARFTAAGELDWSRRWDATGPAAAAPDAIEAGNWGIYVAGTRRDPTDTGYDAFVRWYSPGGTLNRAVSLDAGERYISGSGVAVRSHAVYVSGSVGKVQPWDGDGGLVWRLIG